MDLIKDLLFLSFRSLYLSYNSNLLVRCNVNVFFKVSIKLSSNTYISIKQSLIISYLLLYLLLFDQVNLVPIFFFLNTYNLCLIFFCIMLVLTLTNSKTEVYNLMQLLGSNTYKLYTLSIHFYLHRLYLIYISTVVYRTMRIEAFTI